MNRNKNNAEKYNEAIRDLNFVAALFVFLMASPLFLIVAGVLLFAAVGVFIGIFGGLGLASGGEFSDGLTLFVAGIAVLAGLSAIVVGIFFDKRIEEFRTQRRLEKEALKKLGASKKFDPLDDFGKI